MEQEVGIREQLEYCICLEELSAKLRAAGAAKFLSEKLEKVSKSVEKISQSYRTSKKDKERVDKILNEYQIGIAEMKTEYDNLLKQSEVKIQDCEAKEVECISFISKIQSGSKDLIAKQKRELKENYEKKIEQVKKLKNTNPVIIYLRSKEIIEKVKNNPKLYMDIKEYEKINMTLLHAQQKYKKVKEKLKDNPKGLSKLKNSPELEVYYKIKKVFQNKQYNEKFIIKVKTFNNAKDNVANLKRNANVAKYLNLIDEITQLKVQIKENKQGKSTNIIKEYENNLKSAKKFAKAGRMHEYKEIIRDIRKKESNEIVQEYITKKTELIAIREELENAQNSRAGIIIEMNTQLEKLSKPQEQSLMVIEKASHVKKFFTNIVNKLNLGANVEKNVIIPLKTIPEKIQQLSERIRSNAQQNFRNGVTEIFNENNLERCSIVEIVERFASKKKQYARRIEPSKQRDKQDTHVIQKTAEFVLVK